MSYNTFLRPRPVNLADESACRADRIGRWLAGGSADIVALTETFAANDVARLVRHADERFGFRVLSQPAGTGVFGISGGLSVLSRWPIESTRTLVYSECNGAVSDCVANKGALAVAIRLADGRRIHVVTTHLNAGVGDDDRAARTAQVAELRDFIADVSRDGAPTLLLGDFNIDALRPDGEFQKLVETLKVAPYEVDPAPTLNCGGSELDCDADPGRRLDYVFPVGASGFVRHMTSHLPLADSGCGNAHYLSDHRAVVATFGLAAEARKRRKPRSAN